MAVEIEELGAATVAFTPFLIADRLGTDAGAGWPKLEPEAA